jgi:hypothetical protein
MRHICVVVICEIFVTAFTWKIIHRFWLLNIPRKLNGEDEIREDEAV